ncbi:MAG TPA: DUF222 domain-containing protein, partial [Nocardioidaceae bacterium]|nr:DUF222 domain-containing protein [Nocardioidaceae bacterium]
MIETTGLDVAGVVAAAVECRRVADRAEAELLVVAARWADLHTVGPGADGGADNGAAGAAAGFGVGRDLVGAQRLVPLAGAGTPLVAEFAPGELGAALGITSHAAACLVGDSLELRPRLPRLWAAVHAGRLQAWRARKIAQTTVCLSVQAAGFVDAQVAPVAHKVGLSRVLRLVEVAMRRYDPDL